MTMFFVGETHFESERSCTRVYLYLVFSRVLSVATCGYRSSICAMLRAALTVRRAAAAAARLPAAVRSASTNAAAAPAPTAAAAVASPASAAASGTAPGSLWIWGKTDEHRLGFVVSQKDIGTGALLTGSPGIAPTAHPHMKNVVQVVCAASKTLALDSDGVVWSWGTCRNYSLGHVDTKSEKALEAASRPRRVEALSGIRIVQIAAGETASAALSDEGELFTFGWGGSWWQGNAGLGHGDNVTQPRPALVEALATAGVKLSQVAVGGRHMLGLTAEGQVYSWGSGEYGRCGNGKRKQLVPEPVELLATSGKRFTQVACGAAHSLAVDSEGGVWAWGKNDAGQLGLGGSVLMDLNTMEEFPLLIGAELADQMHENGAAAGGAGFAGRVKAVAAGANHSLALTHDGRVFQWGGRTFLTPQIVPTGYAVSDDEEAAAAAAAAADGKAKGKAKTSEFDVDLKGAVVRISSACTCSVCRLRPAGAVLACFFLFPAYVLPPFHFLLLPCLYLCPHLCLCLYLSAPAAGCWRWRVRCHRCARRLVHVGQEPEHGHAGTQGVRRRHASPAACQCPARQAAVHGLFRQPTRRCSRRSCCTRCWEEVGVRSTTGAVGARNETCQLKLPVDIAI